MEEFLYEQIAGRIRKLIHRGTLRPGERLPSVRRLSEQESVSISTVLQAYYFLESKGLIEARPQSGFYIAHTVPMRPPEPITTSPSSRATRVKMSDIAEKVLEAAENPDFVPLGCAIPSPEFFPNHKIARLVSAAFRRSETPANVYSVPPGNQEFRRQIARRSLHWGGSLAAEDIVVTCGCIEALNLCLRAVTEPGDVVALESPTYYAVIETIQNLGLKALEIPTHPREGISIEALEVAVENATVKACLLVPTCHNPLGSCMSDSRKRKLVKLLRGKSIPLIEDDVYGDLYFGVSRPKPVKAFDREGNVMLCSSLSKTIFPGLRLGWTAPGRFKGKIMQLQRSSTLGTGMLPQVVAAAFLEAGGYDLHLRRMRRAYAENVDRMTYATSRFFPNGTRVTRPRGGFVLWVQLPDGVDSEELFWRAVEHEISVMPGPLFSAKQDYRNFIRLNCGVRWSARVEKAVLTLGRLVEELQACAARYG